MPEYLLLDELVILLRFDVTAPKKPPDGPMADLQ